ncbi:DUF6597 domain-containing transcriptional factor [Streptomyces sp. NPDC058257]|uniref:AraC family transcriptional regulator n=1 Tax=Streptomyces sp. NPDC058257 TaxID=3346409 RepID=UPI0036E2904B
MADASAPRSDTKGIVDAAGLFARVRFRRLAPGTASLRPYVEQYWLIDWDLTEPYASHIVPHPSVNVVFQTLHGQEPFAEVAGVGLGLFTQKLEGRGRACGVKFRPGGFRPFAPSEPVSAWTGRRLLPLDVVFGEVPEGALDAVLSPDEEHARVAALDSFLLSVGPAPDPQADLAMALAERIRADRGIRRVGPFAAAEGMSVRALQRLFSAYVGVGPKWLILRHRIHEALDRAQRDTEVDWADLAATLGYADQAHLIRDFTATVGVPPTAYSPR